MNSFGQFLYELRKEKDMTQAELAELLGVTNKAVSKWETGEAMPETSQLLPLSRIFGVTVDELLAGGRIEKGEEENKTERAEGHIFPREDDGNKTRTEKVSGLICAVLMALGTITYLCLGTFANLWHPYWVIIPVCALACGVIGSAVDLTNVEKRRKKVERGENPYTGCACAIIMLACVGVYLLLGVFTDLWHPLWIIVVVGALVTAVVGAVGAFARKK